MVNPLLFRHRQQLAGLFVHSLCTVMLLVWLNVVQPFLLLTLYNIPSTALGSTTGLLGLADEIWSIFALLILGVVSDYSGRRPILAFGYFTVGLANFVYPYAGTVNALFAVRLLYATGGSALASMLTCIVADVHGDTKLSLTFLVSMIAIGSGVGALIGVFMLAQLPVTFCIEGSYLFMGALCWVLGISVSLLLSSQCNLCCFCCKSCEKGRDNRDSDENVVEPTTTDEAATAGMGEDSFSTNNTTSKKPKKKESLGEHFLSGLDGFLLMRGNPRLVLAYLSGFTARGGAILVTTFFSLWITAYYDANALCWDTKYLLPDGSLNETAVLAAATTETSARCNQKLFSQDKYECRNGFTRASTIGGVAQTCALVGTLIFGLLLSKVQFFSKDQARGVLVASFLGIVSYGAIAALKDPTTSAALILSALAGFAEIAMIISAQTLVVSQMTPENRGAISGSFGFCGGLGIMFITYGGGRLFDAWRFTAPFALMSILSGVVFIAAALVSRFAAPANEVSTNLQSTSKNKTVTELPNTTTTLSV